MKDTSYAIVTGLFVVLTFTTNILAQDSPQWHLPDGVKARYGKGTIHALSIRQMAQRWRWRLALAFGYTKQKQLMNSTYS